MLTLNSPLTVTRSPLSSMTGLLVTFLKERRDPYWNLFVQKKKNLYFIIDLGNIVKNELFNKKIN